LNEFRKSLLKKHEAEMADVEKFEKLKKKMNVMNVYHTMEEA
jgi:hypothetical protein